MKVFITGKSSFFNKLFRKSIKNVEIIEIKSITDRNSKEMIFDFNFLSQISENSLIIHSAWNMEEREEQSSRKINVNGSINFFDSLDEDFISWSS